LKGQAFRSVVLDVDSTLCGIEGIDWLSARRGKDVAERVELETAMAMRGEIPLEAVYANRLSLVKPSRDEIQMLSETYIATIAPGAEGVIQRWVRDGIVVALVSGGIRQAITPLAMKLGIGETRVHAVDIHFDSTGTYSGFDNTSPLSTAMGKREVVKQMKLDRPILTVGDGSTDLATREASDAFAAFTGFAARGPVMRAADAVVESFDQLDHIVTNGI
jgi:phosphoserine phosphatase